MRDRDKKIGYKEFRCILEEGRHEPGHELGLTKAQGSPFDLGND